MHTYFGKEGGRVLKKRIKLLCYYYVAAFCAWNGTEEGNIRTTQKKKGKNDESFVFFGTIF